MLVRYRHWVTPLAIIAAVVLFYMQNPWFYPAANSTASNVATVVFWVLVIVVLGLMFEDRKAPDEEKIVIDSPAFATYLFSSPRAGLLWLPIRIFLGVRVGGRRVAQAHRHRLG